MRVWLLAGFEALRCMSGSPYRLGITSEPNLPGLALPLLSVAGEYVNGALVYDNRCDSVVPVAANKTTRGRDSVSRVAVA